MAAQASGASKDSNASENANSDQAQNASGESADAAQGEDANQDQNGENTEEQDGQQDSGTDETQNGEAEQGGGTDGTDEGTQTEEAMTCVIQIRCDTILNNKENLAEGKSKYVPRDGIILGSTTMEFTEGESAFDVLQRACSENGIALEYSYAPVYGSYYVEGIGNLYEFDCGDESGWMYKVNGWFPNYGCSELKLSDGDVVEFCYTCNGLGEDVGA